MNDETLDATTTPEEYERSSSESATIDEEELRRLYEESLANIKEGAIVSGTIIKVSGDEVYVDIGYKSEGIVPLSEFEDAEEAKAGEEIDVFLESMEDADGMIVLSKTKAERQRRWDQTILRSKEGDIVTGRITRKVRGGVIVDIGMDAFLPASQIDIRHVANVDEYVGKVLDFKIIKINSERKNIVLSRRELLEEERARNREALLAEIEVGQTREGVVKNITDFGAFIDLYGMDGLLHITDITWGRINHPSEVVSVGDKIEVMVLDFDRERQRIALGLKQKTPNPWENIDQKHPVGSIVKGRIVNIVPYGAFFEIEKGVEGLIHISEMSWTKRINHPSEILSVGDEVEAMVLSIRRDEAKISLGIKQTEFNPWSVVEEKYPAGTRVRGRVRNITSYGAFVELEEGIDGLIHISDMSWTRKINHPSEVLKKGEITEAIVLAVDQEAKKITLGLKQLEENPWETMDEFIRVGSEVEAVVTKIADFGVFATIENGIECLIHISQLSEKPFQKIEDVVNKGDKVIAKVDRIDKQRRKIALSIKEYQRDLRLAEERTAMEAARAASFGEESIAGMKEHLEEAMERLSSPAPPSTTPEAERVAMSQGETEGPPSESPPLVAEPQPVSELGVSAGDEGVVAEEPSPEAPPGEETVGEPAAMEEEPMTAEPALEELPQEPIAPEAPSMEEGPPAVELPPEEPSPEAVAPELPATEEMIPTEELAPWEPSPEAVAPEIPPVEEVPAIEEPPPQEPSPEAFAPELPPIEKVPPIEEPAPPEPSYEAVAPEPPATEEMIPTEEPAPWEPSPEAVAPEPPAIEEVPPTEEPLPWEPSPEAVAPEPPAIEEAVPIEEPLPWEPSPEAVAPEPPVIEEVSPTEEPAPQEPSPEAFTPELPPTEEAPPAEEPPPQEPSPEAVVPEVPPTEELPPAEEPPAWEPSAEALAPELPHDEEVPPIEEPTPQGPSPETIGPELPTTEEVPPTEEPEPWEPSAEALAPEPPVTEEEPPAEEPEPWEPSPEAVAPEPPVTEEATPTEEPEPWEPSPEAVAPELPPVEEAPPAEEPASEEPPLETTEPEPSFTETFSEPTPFAEATEEPEVKDISQPEPAEEPGSAEEEVSEPEAEPEEERKEEEGETTP